MSCENCKESAYVIDKLAKLLAEIAVIVNGPEPPLTSWSYHDLPEKVRALKQAPPAAVPADGWKEAAIAWEVCASIHRKYAKGRDALFSTRQQDFVSSADKARAMLAAANKENTNG